MFLSPLQVKVFHFEIEFFFQFNQLLVTFTVTKLMTTKSAKEYISISSSSNTTMMHIFKKLNALLLLDGKRMFLSSRLGLKVCHVHFTPLMGATLFLLLLFFTLLFLYA